MKDAVQHIYNYIATLFVGSFAYSMAVALLIVALMQLSCTGEPGKERQRVALEAMGFKAISFTGPAWVGCAADDSVFVSKHFVGQDTKGNSIEGSVCCGIFKGCTVRL